jgi:hypothetical protein
VTPRDDAPRGVLHGVEGQDIDLQIRLVIGKELGRRPGRRETKNKNKEKENEGEKNERERGKKKRGKSREKMAKMVR